MNKKSVFLLLTFLALPQKSEAIVGWATALCVTGLTYCFGTYITRHTNASSFLRKQDDILRYITYIYVYPERKYRQTTVEILQATTAQEMIEKVMAFAAQYDNGHYSLRARPAVVLKDGNIIQLIKIRLNAAKTSKLLNTITARLIIPESSLHLTYKAKLALGAIPAAVGGGPIALVIPAVMLI